MLRRWFNRLGRSTAQRWMNEDGARFEEEALRHLDSLHRTALRMTRHPQDAEDLVQETYLRAFRFADQFQLGTKQRSLWQYADRRRTRTGGWEVIEHGWGQMVDCVEAERRLHRFVDRELGEAEVAEVQRHLDSCENCRARFRFEFGLRRLVQRAARSEPVREGFRDRIRRLRSA